MIYRYTTRTRTLPGDIHTPVSTYLKLRDLFPQSALMESSDYHEARTAVPSSASVPSPPSVSGTTSS